MKHKMFAIYDQKAEAFLPPWFLPTAAMAKRAFGDCIADKNHQFSAHPQDYTLFEISDFDDATGKLLPLPAKVSLGNGVEFIKPDLADTTADLFEVTPEAAGGTN